MSFSKKLISASIYLSLFLSFPSWGDGGEVGTDREILSTALYGEIDLTTLCLKSCEERSDSEGFPQFVEILESIENQTAKEALEEIEAQETNKTTQ